MKGLRKLITSDQVKAELTPEELQSLDLSLPQMTGGAMQFVITLAEERIQKRVLVEACRAILDDLDVVMPTDLVKHFGASKHKLISALREAGEE